MAQLLWKTLRHHSKGLRRFCSKASKPDNLPLPSPEGQRLIPKSVITVGLLGCLTGAAYVFLPEKERRLYRVTVGGLERFVRSSTVGVATAADYQKTLRGLNDSDPGYEKILSEVHERAAERILNLCLQNGGLYIKLGQGLVVLDHILPKEYIDTLKQLQDKCLTPEEGEVHQMMKEEFGKAMGEIFEEFDEKPIAAASLAQVFKATLKTGEKVAVKVQYIDLQDRFVGDVTTVSILMTVAGWLFPDFDFAWVLNELRGTLEKELNFLTEAQNAEICARDLAHMPFIYIPKIHWDLSTKRVLTLEFIDGIKISDKASLLSKGFSLADIDHKLFKAFAEQIFHTGFVHADPHAGNILIRRGSDRKAELVILDHGLYEVVPQKVRESLKELWKAIVLNDHYHMKKYAMALGIKEADYRLFCIAIGQRYIASVDPNDADAEITRIVFAPQTNRREKFKKLTPQEKAQLHVEISALRLRSLKIFKDMPSKLMLVTRNINTIRSIAHGHGNPVNRYKVMARCATQGAFAARKNSFPEKLKSLGARIRFEALLWWSDVKIWSFKTYLRLYQVLRVGSMVTDAISFTFQGKRSKSL